MRPMRRIATWTVVVGMACALGTPGTAQTVSTPIPGPLSATLERLSLTLPPDIAMREDVRRPLDELSRESCDQTAIDSLVKGLRNAGYRREAARAQVRFSETCGGHVPSLRSAANILLDLSDYSGAADIASELIKLEPFRDNGYYLRAIAHDRGGFAKKAVDDYVTAIELFVPRERISSVGYYSLARNYEKLGQFCDAVMAIETWVALNPARNDTGQTRAMIATYAAKGRCAIATGGKEEVFATGRHGNVVTLQASINGVRGTFILDTGATFVSLKQSFAQKAKVSVDQDSVVRLNTANGVTEAKRGRAKSIELRSLKANDVPLVVQADAKATYGSGVDGLLGMSFLSRYQVTVDAKAVRVRPRPAP